MTYYEKKQHVKERTLTEAEFIIRTHATVRETAKKSGVSKSTVHHDVTVKLYLFSKSLYEDVRKILDENR